MKINVLGEQKEALQLMLQKPFAEQIIAGTKRLEIRSFSPFYVKTLLNVDNFNQWVAAGLPAEHKPIFKKKINYLHFTNRNRSWFLNVEVRQHFVEFLTYENVLQLQKEFNCHDLDCMLPQLKALKESDLLDNVICFELGKVIDTNL